MRLEQLRGGFLLAYVDRPYLRLTFSTFELGILTTHPLHTVATISKITIIIIQAMLHEMAYI